MDDYIIWDYSLPGISFNVDSGRITIFKTTLKAMGYPEFFHFLFSPEDLVFGIEPCHIDDGGANRLQDNLTRDHYAEGTVGVISTWIIAALRDEQFFSLAELNAAIRQKLYAFSWKPFQKNDHLLRAEKGMG